MKRILIACIATTLIGGRALADPIGYWTLDEGTSSQAADAIPSAVNSPILDGKATFSQKGALPRFDEEVPAKQIWDGATGKVANGENRASLRFSNEGITGQGSPVGGQVTVAGTSPLVQPASFTAEAFVKMTRQSPRHALLMSKRRQKPDGATWSLSIDPAGFLRARLDTQTGADGQAGEGFNQSIGSTGNLGDGRWHHVALAYDRATQKADLYLDHVRCGGGVTQGPLVYDAGDLIVGRGLDGLIDEIRLTAEALHPEQFLRPTRFFSDLKPAIRPLEAMLDQTPSRVQTSLQVDLERIGTLKPKGIKDIETSMWSLGCETLDRDLTSWDAYKGYLEPLGIRRIRLQGGWAKTEKVKGVYDFAWLDAIVDDALARGLIVCLETSYGNRLYQKNAALGPGGPLPEGDQTLAAWDRWVEAMALRYSAKGVKEWMMYNEPNLRKENTLEKIVALNLRTAEIIKRVDPAAKIGGLVSCSPDLGLIKGFLQRLKEQDKSDLFCWLIYHGYGANPDTLSAKMVSLGQVMRELAPRQRAWQGEAGCASEEVQFALSGIAWTELSHAKWNARRMLADLGHDIESSVFTISDISYHKDFISRYGLLKTNPDNSIIKVKAAYYAVQNVVSVFNDSVQRVPDYSLKAESEKPLSWYAFRDRKTGLDLVTFWDGTAVPSNEFTVSKATLSMAGGHFQEPVWVDLLTGDIYTIPGDRISKEGDTCNFQAIPVYDSPAVITDKSLLTFEPARKKKTKSTFPQ